MTRDPSRCDYCREPFANNMKILYMLDKTLALAEPMFNVHLSCSYDLLEDLKAHIEKLASDLNNPN